ncbi:hypothetical protein MTP03_15640 [Tsukamurella sp. PLM1]|nr:hypothetical protein MTP03_15640 [Tsukamurella sp. PLM1]
MLAAARVHLLRHQSRVDLHDVGAQAQGAERVRGLQSEQAAADHHADGAGVAGQRGVRVGADRVQVVQGAVDVAAGQVVPRHRRHEGVRAGREHERVVADRTVFGGHRSRVAVDAGDALAEADLHERIARVVVAREGQFRTVPGAHVRRESYPVVRGVGLLAEHHDPPRPALVAGAQRLHEPVAHHSVAHDHDRLRGTHRRLLSSFDSMPRR